MLDKYISIPKEEILPSVIKNVLTQRYTSHLSLELISETEVIHRLEDDCLSWLELAKRVSVPASTPDTEISLPCLGPGTEVHPWLPKKTRGPWCLPRVPLIYCQEMLVPFEQLLQKTNSNNVSELFGCWGPGSEAG